MTDIGAMLWRHCDCWWNCMSAKEVISLICHRKNSLRRVPLSSLHVATVYARRHNMLALLHRSDLRSRRLRSVAATEKRCFTVGDIKTLHAIIWRNKICPCDRIFMQQATAVFWTLPFAVYDIRRHNSKTHSAIVQGVWYCSWVNLYTLFRR